MIDLRAIFQQPHRALDLGRLPTLLLPEKGRYGLRDYEKVFCADPDADIFEMRAIDRSHGCLVIVRPDQYVTQVLPLTAHKQLTQVFENILVPAK